MKKMALVLVMVTTASLSAQKARWTVADDTTWVRPWTVMIPLQRSRAQIFE
jgi:hypothetical protein